MSAHTDEALRAAYWARYLWLQELWRRGERQVMARWGRCPAAVPDMRDEQAMARLGHELEALLVELEGQS